MRRILLALPIAFLLASMAGCSSDDTTGDGASGAAGSGGTSPDGAAESTAPDAPGSDSTAQDGAGDVLGPDAPPDAGTDTAEPVDSAPEAGDDSAVEPLDASQDTQSGDDAMAQDALSEAQQDAPLEAAEDASEDAAQDVGADSVVVDAPNNKPQLKLLLDHDWVWTAIEEDAVTADCVLLDDQGKVLPDPADLTITAPSPAVQKAPGSFSWADAGTYPIQCESASLGLSTSRDVVVTFEGVDYRYVQTTREVSELDVVLGKAMAANEANDVVAFNAAVNGMKELAARIPDLASVGMLVDNPNGWPTDAQLTAAGFVAGPQDAAWLNALQALRQAVAAHRAVLSAMSTPPSAADVTAVSASRSLTESRLQELQAQTPSTFAAWKGMPEIGLLIRELGETTRVRANVMAAQMQAAPPPPPPPPGELKPAFSLVGTLASIAIQEMISSYTYESMLMSVGKTAVASAISIMIKDLINKDLPAGATMPVLQSVHGSAAGFCGAGIPFQTLGMFNPNPAKNSIIFIPPRLSNDLSNIVSVVKGMDGITQEGNVLKLINKIRKITQSLVKIYGAAWGAGDQFIVLTPDGGDDMLLSYPALPTGLNCNQFKLPVAGTMIPVDEDWGHGEAINVNVLGEAMGVCQ